VFHRIVPDGSHTYVINALEDHILPFQKVPTKCFYSDKAFADSNLKLVFSNFYKKQGINQDTVILQGNFVVK